MENLKEIAKAINSLKSEDEIYNFLLEILTEAEVATLSRRWRILTLLSEGKTQRDISKTLGVSLCKVTRGAKILKNQNAVSTQYLKQEKKQWNNN